MLAYQLLTQASTCFHTRPASLLASGRWQACTARQTAEGMFGGRKFPRKLQVLKPQLAGQERLQAGNPTVDSSQGLPMSSGSVSARAQKGAPTKATVHMCCSPSYADSLLAMWGVSAGCPAVHLTALQRS